MNYPLYNNTLCPDLWDKKGDEWTMKPEILKTLRQVVKDFEDEQLKEAGVEVKFEDVVIVGSSTNYNWSSYSDIDLHIMVDYTKMDMTKEEAEAMLSAIKGNWNKSHDITIKGHDLEINFGDVAAKSAITSIYSVQHGAWVMKPVKEKPTFNKELIKKKHAELKAKFEEVLRTDDEAALKKMLEKIYIFRQAGLDKGGELSEENIVFKILRAQGYLDKLKAHINTIYDREMTVKESLGEASYSGNMGVMEIAKFYDMAKPDDISKFEKLAAEETPQATAEAWLLVQAVTGIKLHGANEFGDDAEVLRYKQNNSI